MDILVAAKVEISEDQNKRSENVETYKRLQWT